MGHYVKYCKKCAENKEEYFDFFDLYREFPEFKETATIGYYQYNENDNRDYCKVHPEEKLILSPLTIEEYDIIDCTSTDLTFIHAMENLKEKDPIEFQLKLSQFKTNLATQDASEKIQDNSPKCPTCSSKKIKKISGASKATSVALWGLFSQKVRRQWKCENCGYEW